MIKIDFENDLRNELLKFLPCSKKKEGDELNAMATPEVLTVFLNSIRRTVHPHPRTVCLSYELLINPKWKVHEKAINHIRERIECGETIAPHLSRLIEKGYVANKKWRTKKLPRRSDLDLLLNDWGVQHLHLSCHSDRTGFVKRTGDLLFAIFTKTHAYFLDIMPHKVWAAAHFIEVAVRNWPEDMLFFPTKLLPPRPEKGYTDDERLSLRQVGMTTLVTVDGVAYMSRTGGITTAGTATEVNFEAANILRKLKALSDKIESEPDYLRSYIEKFGRTCPSTPQVSLKLVSGENGYIFVTHEATSDTAIGVHEISFN